MAKDVKFNIKLQIDGKEAIVQASTNVRELARELGVAEEKGRSFGETARDFAAISTAVQNAMSGLQNITGLLRSYTAANAVQVQAEVKLETVMRQRMQATEDEIQAVKDLASAQQQLGVIGDEVQLAGAQQLATFLNVKSSLDTLIPAMNNLLAQQKGYTATGQDAVQIGNMMGKAMQGQVDTLKDVGVTFTAAQAAIMKMGTEEQRAATLAQIITDNVGQMNAALAQTDAGKAQQAANAYGDLKEQVGALFASIEPGLVAFAELGLAMSSVVTIGAGIKSVSAFIIQLTRNVKLSTVATIAHGAATKAAAANAKLWALQLKYANRAQIAWTFGAKTATVQALAMRAAILGLYVVTGVGIAIAAVSTIVSLFSSKVGESNKKLEEGKKAAGALTDAYTNEKGALEQTRAAMQINIARLRDFNGSKEQERKLVEEMNTTYGNTMGYFSSVAEWYKALTANSEAYCRQMVVEARTRALANAIARKEQENHDLLFDETGRARKYSKRRQVKQEVAGTSVGTAGGYVPVYRNVEIVGSSEAEKALQQYRDNLAEIKSMQQQMQEAVKQLDAVQYEVKGKKTKPGEGGGQETALPAKLATLNDYNKAIQHYTELQQNASLEEVAGIQKTIDKLREERDAYLGKAKASQTASTAQDTDMPAKLETLNDYNKAIAHYTELQQNASLEEVAGIQKTIDKLREERDAWLGVAEAKGQAQGTALPEKLSTLRDYNQAIAHYAELQETAGREEYASLQRTIDKLKEERDAFTGTTRAAMSANETGTESLLQLSSAMQQLGGSMEGAAQQWLQWGANLLQAIGQAIPAIMALTMAKKQEANANAEAAVAGAASSVAAIPFVGAVMAVAAIASVVAALASIPKFAKGGIAYGPTLGMFGEYPGAANNPEVVAPLDRLRSLLQPVGGIQGGEVEFKIKGRRLVGILQNENNRGRRI